MGAGQCGAPLQDQGGVRLDHSAIDAYTRLAFSQVLSDEKGPTCAGFFERAQAFFGAHGIHVEAPLTDNAKNYLGKDFARALGTLEHRISDLDDPRRTEK